MLTLELPTGSSALSLPNVYQIKPAWSGLYYRVYTSRSNLPHLGDPFLSRSRFPLHFAVLLLKSSC